MREQAATTRRGTRRRSLAIVAVGLAALAGMFSAVSQNAMAVNFTTGNNTFKLYSNYLDAQQAAAFLAPSSKQNGSNVGVAELGIRTAKLAGLCAIAQESVGILGTFSLMITAGDNVPDSVAYTGTGLPATSPALDLSSAGQLQGSSLSGAITADNLFVNSNALAGFGNKISGLNLGQSAETVSGSAGLSWPTGQTGPVNGNFGLYANQLNVAGLNGETYGLNLAGAITLPKLAIKVLPGAKTQNDCS